MPSTRTALRVPTLDQVYAALAAKSLREFAQQAWPIIEPGNEYRSNWHIDAIISHLEAVSTGELRRLIINVPPRSGKSNHVSVLWPAWTWLLRPEIRWLFASYSGRLAKRDSVRCRRIVEHRGGRTAGGTLLERVGYRGILNLIGRDWELTSDQNEKIRYENSATGVRIATSVGGTATGEGGDIIVIDDPQSADESESEAQRANVLDWMDGTMSTRLNDPNRGAVVVIMQRLHEEDVTGHLLAQGGYTHLCLPAEYEPSHPFVWPADPREEEGELLWPDHFTPKAVEDLKARMGSWRAAGQLQQRPAPAAGGLFRARNFRYWSGRYEGAGRGLIELATDAGTRPVDLSACTIFQTIDVAATIKQWSDYTVVLTCAATPLGELVVLDIARERLESPDQPAYVIAGFGRHRPAYVAIEAKTFGLSLGQELMRRGLPIRRLEADTDKVSRAMTVAVMSENHKVFFPEGATAFELELLHFPNAAHDDQVDALAYAGLLMPVMAQAARPSEPVDAPLPVTAGLSAAMFR